jgi:hypothetical protein
MRAPSSSPEALLLGALWATLMDAVVLAALLVCWVNGAAPPQDLPWKPLRLADPPGFATDGKFARVAADPAACRLVLREGGVRFDESPPQQDGGCTQLNAVRLRAGVTTLSPAAPIMTCPQALAYAFWDRHGLQPAARDLLGTSIVGVDHLGTYACRNVYGREQGRRSQHAFANALDVGGFRTADGRRLRILGGFEEKGMEGVFLRESRDSACRWFRATLSPDYNAAHADHLHLDFGPYGICR